MRNEGTFGDQSTWLMKMKNPVVHSSEFQLIVSLQAEACISYNGLYSSKKN